MSLFYAFLKASSVRRRDYNDGAIFLALEVFWYHVFIQHFVTDASEYL